MNKSVQIGRHRVGLDHPTYFIVDIGANYDGSLERAKDLIHLAAESGTNAAKFQNFRAPTIVSEYGFRALGRQLSHQAAWKKSVREVYEDASLPLEWAIQLKQTCDGAGIDYFTAPYDIDLLDQLSHHVCAWKVGSGDITWLENIEAMAAYRMPILLATGASDMSDVRRAVEVVKRHTDELILMQCNTNYTGSPDGLRYVALNVLKTYAEEFPDVVLGLSDHTPGFSTVLGAVALGARVIEKHFTDDRSRTGPDHSFSMIPAEWREMVDRARELELALGPKEKRVMENEEESVVLQRRAVRARCQIAKGKTVVEADLIPLRPCPNDALQPYRKSEVVGRRAVRDIPEGECVRPSDVE